MWRNRGRSNSWRHEPRARARPRGYSRCDQYLKRCEETASIISYLIDLSSKELVQPVDLADIDQATPELLVVRSSSNHPRNHNKLSIIVHIWQARSTFPVPVSLDRSEDAPTGMTARANR